MSIIKEILRIDDNNEITMLLKQTDSSIVIDELIKSNKNDKKMALAKIKNVVDDNYFAMLLTGVKFMKKKP